MKGTKDQVAKEIFNTTYNSLSSWGKLIIANATEETAPHTVTLTQEETKDFRNRELEQQLKLAKQENFDLWEENQELRIQLSEKE